MADLSNGETAVDEPRNRSTSGDSGNRKRKASSCYLLAGGSRDIYSVTINFETGHFCKVDGGANCKGNMHGKGQKFGPINARDTGDRQAWCKHVQAALANTEAIAEAQEITAQAFGKAPATVKATVKPPVPAFEAPSPSGIAPQPVQTARERLAALEVEAATLRENIEADDKATELRCVVAELVKVHGWESVRDAVKVA